MTTNMTKTAKNDDQFKNQRAVFDKPVARQGPTIYKVLSAGTCVDFTDKIASAEESYKDSSKPREMWRLTNGSATLLKKEVL